MAASDLLGWCVRSWPRRHNHRISCRHAVDMSTLRFSEEIHGCPNPNGGDESMEGEEPQDGLVFRAKQKEIEAWGVERGGKQRRKELRIWVKFGRLWRYGGTDRCFR